MKKKIQQWVQQAYDHFICTPSRLAQQSIKKSRPESRKFSVAIPHYNRGNLIHRPLWNIINNDAVEEIVIVDDGSSKEEFDLLVKNVARYDQRKIVTIHRREENKGALFTKIECVEKTRGEWMILLDSDNTLLSGYLKAIQSLHELKKDTIYCPDWAFPYFSFHQLVGQKINFQRACELTQQGVLQRVYIINDGNYFFNRNAYLSQLSKLKNIQNDYADVIVSNYCWLSQGGSLAVMCHARYIHRIDDSSFWLRTSHESKKRVMIIYDRFKKEQRWDHGNEFSLDTFH